MSSVRFSPRRLGHVNIWVSDLERSIRFYEDVCGLELVRRERALKIAFHSNGNTHHDIGMVETSRGVDRYGRNGLLQIPKTRGTSVGLNHLGWEMENEQQLVDGYRRALATNLKIARTMDHLISHSVYVSDPDGNAHEFYADQMRNWRSVYNLDCEDEVSGDWDPLTAAPGTEANYNADPPIRKVETAPLHPSRLTDVVFATPDMGTMCRFFEDVAGLAAVRDAAAEPADCVVYAGASNRPDVILRRCVEGEPKGMRCFTFELTEPCDDARVAKACAAEGIMHARATDERGRDVLRLFDPDGFTVAFCHPSGEPVSQ
jgi:catechol 2,3-dioxygenase